MKRRLLAVVGAVCGTFALSGCGASGPQIVDVASLTPAAAAAKMAESAESVHSASYKFSMAAPGGLNVSGHGEYANQPAPAMDLVMDSMSIPDPFGIVPKASMNGIEERVVGGTLYLRMPGLPGIGSKWLKSSLAVVGGSDLNLGSLLSQASSADPTKQLQGLFASPNMHSVGKERVAGAETTHWTGEVTADDIAKSPTYDATTRASLEKLYARSGVGPTHVDVWVDSDFRVRRFTTSTPSPLGKVAMDFTFLSHNQPVSVEAPKASETTDLNDLGDLVGSAPASAGTHRT